MRAAVIALALLLIVPTANADHHATKKLGEVLVCAKDAPFRSAPGIRGKIISTIKPGTLIPVFQTFERNWLQVAFEGRKGWVHRTQVKWDYQLRLHRKWGKAKSCSEPLPEES